MKWLIIPMVMFLASCQYLTEDKELCSEGININHRIRVINEAKTPLICQKVDYENSEWKYSKGFEVGPLSSKYMKMCSYNTRYACQLITEHEHTTFITYLTPYISGDYKVTLENVPWQDSRKQKTRRATVIELPSGEKVNGCNCNE